MSTIEFIQKLVAILLSLLILVNGFVIKRKKNTWLYPGALFSLFWFAFTFFPLAILFKTPIDLKSQLYIFVVVILFSNSFLIHDFIFRRDIKECSKQIDFKKDYLIFVTIFFVAISIICLFYQLKIHGFTFERFIYNPIQFAEEYSSLRYDLKLKNGISNFISFLGAYLSAIFGGFIYFFTKIKHKKFYAIFSFLPSVALVFSQSAKGPFFLSLFFFLGSGLAFNLKKEFFILFEIKKIIKFIRLALVLFILIFVSFLSRGFSNITDYGQIIEKMKYLFATYFFGHIYSFSDWFNAFLGYTSAREYDISVNGYGYYTFNSVTRYYNLDKYRVRGVFPEFYHDERFNSQIYTVFRGLIMDFGLSGSLIVMLLLGFLCHRIYAIYIGGRLNVVCLTSVIFMFACFYMSFMGSLFYWTAGAASFVITLIITNFIYVKKAN